MEMRPLIMTMEVENEIRRVKEYAESHPITERQLIRMIEGVEPPVGDDLNHIFHIPIQVHS